MSLPDNSQSTEMTSGLTVGIARAWHWQVHVACPLMASCIHSLSSLSLYSITWSYTCADNATVRAHLMA